MLRLGNALQQRVNHLVKAINRRDDITHLVTRCSKVRSQTEAEKASHLIVTNLPNVPPNLRPPILILAVHVLSAYRVFPPLEPSVKLFIGLPIFYEHRHFNSLLRALMHSANSPTDGRIIGRLAVLLLKTMTERELSLTKRTYRFLLQNRYVTMELTEELRQRMIRDNVVPDRAHLESFLRIYATNRGDASSYAQAIQTPSGTVEYLQHLVQENAQRGTFNADAEWARFLKTGHSHRFPKQRASSAATWAARLMSLSRTRTFSPESLVAFFDWSHAQHFPFRTHTTLCYTIVLQSLLRKGAYTLALDVWERFRARRLRVDAVALGVGVEVLTRSGHAERALALLDETSTTTHVPPSVIARFMRALSTTNPSSALSLWEHMHLLYGTLPDAHAFSIMLDAARHATLNGDSLAGAIQELGLPFRLRRAHAHAPPLSSSSSSSSLDKARRTSYETLKRSLTTNRGDMWGTERAWRRAYRLFTNALLAAWPALVDVRAPAYAMRASGDGAATAPLRDLGRFLIPRAHTPIALEEEHEHEPENGPPLLPVHTHGAAYCPSFAPDDATFRSAILLLGAARSAGDIPLLLARMRALGIVPRKRTLAYALVFWAEVSVGAPLVERWLRADSSKGEYVRLVRWLEEWVGAGAGGSVPDEADVGEAMRRVDAMRRRQQQKIH